MHVPTMAHMLSLKNENFVNLLVEKQQKNSVICFLTLFTQNFLNMERNIY